jgi:hypothetical protein
MQVSLAFSLSLPLTCSETRHADASISSSFRVKIHLPPPRYVNDGYAYFNPMSRRREREEKVGGVAKGTTVYGRGET